MGYASPRGAEQVRKTPTPQPIDSFLGKDPMPTGLVRPSAWSALRVLIADDEPLNHLLAMAQLLAFDILPFTANDGLEAVRMAREQDFDIILMDLQMPVMDGLSAAAFIRDFQRNNPMRSRSKVVAFTASNLSDEELLGKFGMDHVLRKPCEPNGMERCISKCCSGVNSTCRPAPSPASTAASASIAPSGSWPKR
jgi:CheY-like chemotaxis protein